MTSKISGNGQPAAPFTIATTGQEVLDWVARHEVSDGSSPTLARALASLFESEGAVPTVPKVIERLLLTQPEQRIHMRACQLLYYIVTPHDADSFNELLKGHPETQLKLADKYLHGRHGLARDAQKACDLAVGAGEQGLVDAWKNLAEWFRDGSSGIFPNRKKHLEYREKAGCLPEVLIQTPTEKPKRRRA